MMLLRFSGLHSLCILAVINLAAVIWADEVSFDPSRGIVEVPVTLNGAVVGKFGVDTGADRLYIDKTFAQSNNLPIRKRADRMVVGIEGQSEASALDLRSFEFAGNTLHNITGTVIDMGAMVSDKRFGYPDGLIGYELLQRCYVTVDYKSKTLDLQMNEPDFLADNTFAIAPFDIRYHLILVEGIINDSIQARFILDYCASVTTITPDICNQLGLQPDVHESAIVSNLSVGEVLSSDNVRVFVDELANLKKQTGELKIDGILGANFLFRHKITVDYKRDRLYIHF